MIDRSSVGKCRLTLFSPVLSAGGMQAVEEAESSLSDRVEVMGVREQEDKSTEEDTQKESKGATKTEDMTEDEKGMNNDLHAFPNFVHINSLYSRCGHLSLDTN